LASRQGSGNELLIVATPAGFVDGATASEAAGVARKFFAALTVDFVGNTD